MYDKLQLQVYVWVVYHMYDKLHIYVYIIHTSLYIAYTYIIYKRFILKILHMNSLSIMNKNLVISQPITDKGMALSIQNISLDGKNILTFTNINSSNLRGLTE